MTHPSQTLAIIGHDEAKKQVESAFDSGKMHHAWLLTGPEGIGKASFAYHVAHLLLSNGENRFGRFNPGYPAAKLVMAGSHPDLLVLSRPADEKTGALKDTIPVEEARKLAPFMRMTASHAGRRVALIDEAHRMGRNAQNAILKMIEEPPAGAVVLLTATTAGAMLPTIRSRCRALAMSPLSATEMDVVFARLGLEMPTGAVKEKWLALSGGSVGKAMAILETEALPLFDEALALLLAEPFDLQGIHKLADRIGRKADVETFRVLTSLLLDVLQKAARAVALGQPDETGVASRLRLDKALDLWENARCAFAAADGANLDNKLAFIAAMTNMARAVGS